MNRQWRPWEAVSRIFKQSDNSGKRLVIILTISNFDLLICIKRINGNIKYAMEMAVNMNDISIMADVLNQINQSVNIWNLDICLTLLPSIKELISSKYEDHAQIGSDSCKIIFKNFGKLIKSSLTGVVSVGVDLTREERQRKCNSCYGYFQDIISIIERKMPGITSQKLINNFREINLLMKTLETW